MSADLNGHSQDDGEKLGRRRRARKKQAKPPSGQTPAPAGATGRWLYADKSLSLDDENTRDALDLGAYAAALALLMDSKDVDTPLTIAINGPWGSGKTSLAEMAEFRLRFGSDWGSPHVLCKFDAWANDDAPHLGAAFAAAVAKAVNSQRHSWRRLGSPLPSAMLTPVERWRRRLLLWVFAVVIAAVAIFWPTGGSLYTALLHPAARIASLGHGAAAARLAWPALVIALIASVQQLWPGVQSLAAWIDSPKSEAARGSMRDVSDQLGRLIRQALRGKRRLIIFVDNLERCRPPRAVEVCEVVSQLIGHKNVVTVLIGDMDTIALSAEIKYAALESVPAGRRAKIPAGAYGRAYLEKLIQIQLRLPTPRLHRVEAIFFPTDNEPLAFPEGQALPGLATRQWGKVTTALNKQRLVAAMAVTVATVGTFGADVLVTVAVATAGLSIAAFYEVLSEKVRAFRQDRKRKAIDKVVERVVPLEKTTLDGHEAVAIEVRAESPEVGDVDDGDVIRRMRQRLLSPRAVMRVELDQALMDGLPVSPRGAKRMINHAHLLLDIGIDRSIFGPESGLLPKQLATWVCFTERWPTMAVAVMDNPQLMEYLEQMAHQPSQNGSAEGAPFASPVAEAQITAPDPSLLDYLRKAASVAAVVDTLVSFSPAQPPDGQRFDAAGLAG
jgi:hypothetical protein